MMKFLRIFDATTLIPIVFWMSSLADCFSAHLPPTALQRTLKSNNDCSMKADVMCRDVTDVCSAHIAVKAVCQQGARSAPSGVSSSSVIALCRLECVVPPYRLLLSPCCWSHAPDKRTQRTFACCHS